MGTLRNPANWCDPPTAAQVALAIVAASREVGADPADVASGVTGKGNQAKNLAVGRARSYAAKALAKVFTSYPRTRIAGFVGARGLVRQSYFSALDQRLRAGVPWWDDAVLARVVGAVASGVMPAAKVIEPPLLSDETKRKVGEYLNVPIYEVPSIPPADPKAPPGLTSKPAPYKGGISYRPPPGTYEKTLAADLEDDEGPVFDAGSLGGLKKPQDHRPRAMSKAEMEADLTEALRRTALLQKPED